jgi:mannose-1-phosphate guanylyltransferase
LSGSTKSSSPDRRLWAVILAGGVGSRFWPVSTPRRPKQLLRLAGSSPLIVQTVERVLPLVPPERMRVLTGMALAEADPGRGARADAGQLLLEPAARGTAPVLAWAAHAIAAGRPGAVMVSLHSDHVIEPAAAFRSLLPRAADCRVRTAGCSRWARCRVARRRGTATSRRVRRWTEDGARVPCPVRGEAGPARPRYIAAGCLWNTGIFVWPAAAAGELRRTRRSSPAAAPAGRR